jgi:ADP-heptose:LPS heptosyltransferase
MAAGFSCRVFRTIHYFCCMKFLIIRFSSIGDIVLTTPVVRCLKKQLVTAEVHYLTKSSFQSIVESNPYIDKAHYLEDDIDSLAERLKQEDFDYVIDLHHNIRTLKIKRALGKRSFSFRKLNVQKWLLTAFKINRLPDIHIVDRYLETVSEFGVKNDGAGLDYFIPEYEKVKDHDIPTSHLAGYIGVVIGAALNTKKLPLERLAELCDRIRQPIILLGGKEDVNDGNIIAATDPQKIYNACGKFSLNESADLVRRAKFIITHDTGLMHIAAAFNKPMISVWGNTVPEFGMTAYFSNNNISDTRFEVTGLSCRPCSKIGYKKCPRGHFKCMRQQDITGMVNRAVGNQ